jgi:hypothetical protein
VITTENPRLTIVHPRRLESWSPGSPESLEAADLAPIGNFSTGAGSQPFGACSDGAHFFITLQGITPGSVAQF